jgi:hypothetical protein
MPLSKIILYSSELGLEWTATPLYHDQREPFGRLVSTATNVSRKTLSTSVPPR